MTLVSVARRFFHAILPVQCATCEVALMTTPCPSFAVRAGTTVQPIRGPFCPCCGRPFASSYALQYSPDHLCGPCRATLPRTPARGLSIVYAPRFKRRFACLNTKESRVGGCVGRVDESSTFEPDSIDYDHPVPLYPTRLRDREYNQSLLLADRVSRARRIPLSYDNLIRIRETAPQTDLSRAVRLKNLRRAFAVHRPQEICRKTHPDCRRCVYNGHDRQ